MEIEMDALTGAQRYKVLASLVTPRPIAWVTTADGKGRVNAAPFSYFNVFGSNPPIVAFAPGNKVPAGEGNPAVPKDTARNIRETKEFVVNLVDEPLGEAMVKTSANLEHGESELEAAGLTGTASTVVQPPRIAESPVALECREWATLEIGANRLVVGVVVRIWVRDGLMDPDSFALDREQFAPLGRMASPDWYCRTRDQFEMVRSE